MAFLEKAAFNSNMLLGKGYVPHMNIHEAALKHASSVAPHGFCTLRLASNLFIVLIFINVVVLHVLTRVSVSPLK